MATGTLGTAARDYHTKQTTYLSYNINFATFSGTTSVKMGTVPANAALLRAFTNMSVAFNAGTNNQISLGTASSGTQLASAANGPATVGTTSVTLTAGSAQAPTADQDIWLTAAFTGAAPTTGNGYVYLEYATP